MAAKEKTLKVTLVDPVRHDGVDLEAGSTVELPASAAEALVAGGWATVPGAAAPAEQPAAS